MGTHRTNHPVHCLTKPFEKVRMEKRQNQQHPKTCFVIHERTSRYDPLSSCLVDFKGRANMASVKNCQFVVSDPEADLPRDASLEAQMKHDADKDFVMQLGKVRISGAADLCQFHALLLRLYLPLWVFVSLDNR